MREKIEALVQLSTVAASLGGMVSPVRHLVILRHRDARAFHRLIKDLGIDPVLDELDQSSPRWLRLQVLALAVAAAASSLGLAWAVVSVSLALGWLGGALGFRNFGRTGAVHAT